MVAKVTHFHFRFQLQTFLTPYPKNTTVNNRLQAVEKYVDDRNSPTSDRVPLCLGHLKQSFFSGRNQPNRRTFWKTVILEPYFASHL